MADTWRRMLHLLVPMMLGSSWVSFLVFTEGARGSCEAGRQTSDHHSDAGKMAERPSLCPGSTSSLERNQLLRPPKTGLYPPKQGMLFLLGGTPWKNSELGLLVLASLYPNKRLHFCQATDCCITSCQRRTQTPCLRPSTGRGAVNCHLLLLVCRWREQIPAQN